MSEHTDIVRPSRIAFWLSMLVALFALIAAGVGLFWDPGTAPVEYTTPRAEIVERYGSGLYRYDSLFKGAGFRGTDAAILVIAIPFHLYAIRRYRRADVTGFLLLSGTLAFFLYNYASYALGATYNSFFLFYVLLFSASLYALVFLWRDIDIDSLKNEITGQVPWRWISSFMFAAGGITLLVWIDPLITALLNQTEPAILDGATTMVTDALDLAIIVPACMISGVLLLRRDPLGVLIAFPLLTLLLILGPVIAGQTISQLSAGVTLSPGEVIGPLSGFLLLALIDLWIMRILLRALPRGILDADQSPIAQEAA